MVQLVKEKYLKNNNHNVLQNKRNLASNAWKNILEHKHLFRNGLLRVLRNGNNINFSYDNC